MFPKIPTFLWRKSLSRRNQLIDLYCKLCDWFPYNRDLRLERVNEKLFSLYPIIMLWCKSNCLIVFSKRKLALAIMTILFFLRKKKSKLYCFFFHFISSLSAKIQNINSWRKSNFKEKKEFAFQTNKAV